MKKPNKKDRKYYDNFIMMNGRQENRIVPSRYIKDLEKYIEHLESQVNTGVLDDANDILLSKYVRHVYEEEGSDFISRCNDGCSSIKFTEEELIILEKISLSNYR